MASATRCGVSRWVVAGHDRPPAASPQQQATTEQTSIAVVDANAIIAGLRLDRVAEQVVTISEVLKEIRDKQSREYLEALPVSIQCLEPSEESVRAVMAFARDSGELQSLSTVDMKLIALAHTLEVRMHGLANLRTRPPPPRVHAKGSAQGRQLPGWGEEGPEWDALDQDSQDLAAAGSRIASNVQALSLEDHGKEGAGEDGEEDASGAGAEASGQEVDDDGAWEVAAASSNAARRRKRKQARQAARMTAAQATKSSFAGDTVGSDEEEAGHGSRAGEEQHPDGGEAQSGSSEEDWEAGDEEDTGSEADEQAEEAASSSGVVCVTADYAMQNVILQMGLRLAAPDGMRITRTRRWALRCTACFQVSKETGRLFCGKCGNVALQKVEVVVGPNGAEQYGVRKKHVLRGTRFSLPKPKGGKHGKDPILREDVLLQRVPQLRHKKKEEADPFAPEFSNETWYQKSSALPAHVKAAAASLDVWKRNPNERKHVRTNRRRK